MSERALELGDAPRLVGLAAASAVVDHYVGLIDVVVWLTALLWVVDMLGGTARASARAFLLALERSKARRRRTWGALCAVPHAWDPGKAVGGASKLLAVVLGVIIGGALEMIQQAMIGASVPVVVPFLATACAFFGKSILGQIGYFWGEMGAELSRLASRAVPSIRNDERGAEP